MRMQRAMVPTWACGALACLVGLMGCEEPPVTSGLMAPIDENCTITVVHSDYGSTSVSLLDDDGTLCADNIVHSGSQPMGLVTALSGDVVLPSTPHPSGWITLIDRHPHAVLSFIDPVTGRMQGQLPVGISFPANPHDVAFISEALALITRHKTQIDSAEEPTGNSDGGDLLLFDPIGLEITGRIDLNQEADRGGTVAWDPMPDRVVLVGGLVWVSLNHLSRDFMKGGPGRVVAIDPHTEQIVHRLELPDRSNCGPMVRTVTSDLTPSDDGFWLICTGVFAQGHALQMEKSALVYVDVTQEEPQVEYTLPASALGAGPLGFGLAPLGPDTVAVVSLGSLNPHRSDTLWSVNRITGEIQGPAMEGVAFSLNQLLTIPDTRILLVTSADPQIPRVRRIPILNGQLTEALSPVFTNPSVGLEPRHLQRFRQGNP